MVSHSPTTTQTSDRSKCAFCQLDSKEPLTRPTDAGYQTIAENINQFSEPQCMPVQADVTRLGHGDNVEPTYANRMKSGINPVVWSLAKVNWNVAKNERENLMKNLQLLNVFAHAASMANYMPAHMWTWKQTHVCFFCSKPETSRGLHVSIRYSVCGSVYMKSQKRIFWKN